MRYKELVERQKIEELKPIKVKEVTKNMRNSEVLGIMEGVYGRTWYMKEEDLENTKEVVAEFEERIGAEVRR